MTRRIQQKPRPPRNPKPPDKPMNPVTGQEMRY